MPPSVSVIIPNFNKGPYLAECLQSCIDQGPEYVLEVIFVDDHSTDNSLEEVEAFRRRHPGMIKVFTNPRKGAAAARNFGFAQCVGDYIQYLDSDDVLSENKVQAQLAALMENSSNSIANCPWEHFRETPGDMPSDRQITDKSYEQPVSWLIDCMMGKGMGVVHGWLTPRALIEKAGPWNEELTVNDDGEFFSRVLLKADYIHFVPTGVAYYRLPTQNNLSQMQVGSDAAAASLLRSYQLIGRHVLAFHDTIACKDGYARLLKSFIYGHYKSHQKHVHEAFEELKILSVKDDGYDSKGLFSMLSKIFGFKAALSIKACLLSFYRKKPNM